jgi:coenzyme Q-binding protein COQ10
VVVDPAARTIDVVQTDGPFRVLENHWRFVPKDNVSEVMFRIAFEFKNRLLNMVAGQAFEHVLFKMTDAFEARAKELSEHPL